MKKRANGAGTLYNRNGTWYTKMKVGGRWVRQSTGETDKTKALAVLNSMSRGHDLSDAERLAAIEVRLRGSGPSPDLATAWDRYCAAPENSAQTELSNDADHARWRYFTRWLHGYRRGKTKIVAAHPEVKTLNGVTPEIATEFIAALKSTSAPETVNKYTRTLRRFWRLNEMRCNPWERFRLLPVSPQLRRALSDDEVQSLVSAATGEMRVLFMLGIYTGLRMSDCAHVRWRDIDETSGIITLKPSKTAHSSGRVVSIPMHPALARVLSSTKRRDGTDFVLPELAALPKWDLSYRVTAHFRACGFELPVKPSGYRRAAAVVGFHSLRSTFITNMANIGAPMAVVQAIVGHMSMEMSMHYYRANAEAARSALSRLPSFA